MNYIELQQAIQNYAENTESLFVSSIPTFIQEAEERIYNTVQLPSLRKNVTGVTTVTTTTAHNFNVGDEVTMSGLAFTCSGSTGITTTIFPSPQQSFIVNSIVGSVGVSKTFVTNSGVVAGIVHTYASGGQAAPLQMEFICSILENSTT